MHCILQVLSCTSISASAPTLMVETLRHIVEYLLLDTERLKDHNRNHLSLESRAKRKGMGGQFRIKKIKKL